MNTEEKKIRFISLLSWSFGLAAYPVAIISEKMKFTTDRAEAGIAASYLWLWIMVAAVVFALVALIRTILTRKMLSKKFFFLGISPVIALSIFALILAGVVVHEDHVIGGRFDG